LALVLVLVLMAGAFPRRRGGTSRNSLASPLVPAFFFFFPRSFELRPSRRTLSSSHFSCSSLIRSSRSTRARSLQMPGLQSDPCWGHVHSPFFFTFVGSSSRGVSYPSHRFTAPLALGLS